MLKATDGQRFGRLVLTGKSERDGHSILHVEAKCDCGTLKLYRMSGLLRGDTRSCGCLRAERNNNHRHGDSKSSRLYRIWKNMHSRCRNPHQASYQRMGLTVCEEWGAWETFRDWSLANGYSDGLSIDRIDNEKGYDPSNCRWATSRTQTRNKSVNRRLTLNGLTMTAIEWCESGRCSVKYSALMRRLKLGWSDERALTEPSRLGAR